MPFRPVPSSSGSREGSIRWPVISESCHVRDVGSREEVCDVWDVWDAGEESVEVGGGGGTVGAEGDISVVVVIGKTVGAGKADGGGGETILRRAGRGLSDPGGVAGRMVSVSAKLGGGNGDGVRDGCTGCSRGAGCGVSWISSIDDGSASSVDGPSCL